jgi:hypothetical protein
LSNSRAPKRRGTDASVVAGEVSGSTPYFYTGARKDMTTARTRATAS